MANFVYTTAKENIAKGLIDFDSHDIKFALCSAGYVAVAATDYHAADFAAGLIATSGILQSCTTTDGVVDYADITVPTVTGAAVTQLVLYDSTADLLIADFNTGTGIPFTPNGGDVTLQFPSDAGRLLKFS
jgi:flagellar basal body rod protein FlgF